MTKSVADINATMAIVEARLAHEEKVTAAMREQLRDLRFDLAEAVEREKYESPLLTIGELMTYFSEYYHQHQVTQRYGQAIFNALLDVNPLLADELRSTPADPFYDDAAVPTFFAYVIEKWQS